MQILVSNKVLCVGRMLLKFSTDLSVRPVTQNPLTSASVPRGCRRGQLEANSDRAAADADVWLAAGETPKLGLPSYAAGFGGGFSGYAREENYCTKNP